VPRRRTDNRRPAARAASAAGSVVFRLWAKVTDRPVDSFAIFGAGVVSLVIIVNAVFLQSGAHPAPFVVNSKPVQATGDIGPKAVILNTPTAATTPAAPVRPAVTPVAAQPVAVRRNDPIADLIGQSPRIMAVQRALSDYGYGQIKPSGILDDPTSKAIERFERERKLPVTGRITDRFISELKSLTGHGID
jgi:hypothetical protein